MNYLSRATLALILTILVPIAPAGARADPGTILTVGQTGAYATIQSAVDTALTTLANSPIEIRVATGTYHENINIPAAMNQGSVILSGGWNADFTNRTANPALTTIDGSSQDRVFDLRASGGEVTIDGFTITNGQVLGTGAGLSLELSGDAKVTLDNDRISNNTSLGQDPGAASGGGIYAYLPGTTRLVVTNSTIDGNRCDGGTNGAASGAGLRVIVDHDAFFTIRNNRIENNRTSAPGNQSTGVGVFLYAFGNGSGEFSDNLVRYNTADPGPTVGAAGALWMSLNSTGRITARRNAWVDNATNSPGEDVNLISAHTGVLLFTDSIVAGGRYVGIAVDTRDTGAVYLTNLTIADNQHTGVFFYDAPGTRTLYNSILYGNGVAPDLDGVNASNNLIDVDPLFADSAGRDYRLLPTSPGIDAGANDPPGGRGATDMDGHARITGDTIDIGAYELGEPDFSLGVEPMTVTTHRKTKTTVRIDITRFGGFSGNVTVTAPDLSAIGVKWKPKKPISTTGASVSFKLKVKAHPTLGVHEVTFTARDDSGRERTATLTLVIE